MLKEIVARRASRDFDPNRPVEKEKLDEIIEAGLYAPSGMNAQTSIIIVISDKKTRDALAKLNASIMGRDGDPFYGAPTICLVAALKDGLCYHDGAATIENMLIEATHQGVDSCWVHRAKEELQSEEGREILASTGLDFTQYIGIGHVCLGYSMGAPKRPRIIRPCRVYKI